MDAIPNQLSASIGVSYCRKNVRKNTICCHRVNNVVDIAMSKEKFLAKNLDAKFADFPLN